MPVNLNSQYTYTVWLRNIPYVLFNYPQTSWAVHAYVVSFNIRAIDVLYLLAPIKNEFSRGKMAASLIHQQNSFDEYSACRGCSVRAAMSLQFDVGIYYIVYYPWQKRCPYNSNLIGTYLQLSLPFSTERV